jgi:beta-N-acetylhexosaminidase
MSNIDLAKKVLGEMFIIGFEGLDLSDDTAAFISQAGIGGVIYFSHNYESPAQVAELSNQIQECRTELPLWISVDHEGGKVQRFKKAFTKIPDAASIAALDSPKLIFEISEMIAKELKAVGINLNYTPVADINTNPKNPIIGNRAFGKTEDEVSKNITAMVRGHVTAGVQPCVKHFPGHGDTTTDSHLQLPKVDTTLEVLQNREFRPFTRAFKSHCAFVMTAHILNPALDPKFPATLSKKTINEVLRKNLRYSRIVLTDDMEMKAITDHYGAEEAPKMAIEAGCDILLYRTEKAARHAYASLLKYLEEGSLDPNLVLEANERIKSVKKEVLLPYQAAVIADVGQKVGTPEHLALVERIKPVTV